ncbi:MAG TPA: DMT family transporter [Candidatus Evtepia faecigallinarum]|nr:DMT family transporter [Candidatus Evtepia faecigallinarum]
MKQNTAVRGTLCALLGGVCWGFSGTMGQYLFSAKGLETAWVTTVRMLLAGVLLLGVLAARQPKEVTRVWRVGKDARRLVLFAALGLIPCQFTYLECIAYSNSATGTALNYLGQMMILFYVCLTTRRLPTRWEITALLLAMLGVFFLATHGNIHTLVLSPQALFWGLLGAAMVVVYSALPRPLLAVYGSPAVTGWGMLVGGVVLFFLSRFWQQQVALDWQTVAGVLLIGVVGTAMAFTLYLQGVRDIGPVKTSLLSCAELVTAGILTCLWLKTPLVLQDFVGMALILGMVVFLSFPGKSAPDTPPAQQT